MYYIEEDEAWENVFCILLTGFSPTMLDNNICAINLSKYYKSESRYRRHEV